MRGRNSSADSGPGLWEQAISNLLPIQQSWPKALNPGGLEACVREDLMDLLNERNQLG